MKIVFENGYNYDIQAIHFEEDETRKLIHYLKPFIE